MSQMSTMAMLESGPQAHRLSQSKQKKLPVEIYFWAEWKFTLCFI